MRRFVEVERAAQFLLPVDIRDWVPEDHIVHFIIEAVEAIATKYEFRINERGFLYSGDVHHGYESSGPQYNQQFQKE